MKNIVLYYLRFFARLAIAIHKPKIIGITGSVGKSSTRNAVYSMMKDFFKVKIVKEGNSETGIPLGILGIDPGHYRLLDWIRIMFFSPFKLDNIKNIEYLIVEMGIDSPFPPKNMDYLLSIVKPDISVVLNVYPVHTMQFDVLFDDRLDEKKRLDYVIKRIAKEKLKIITKASPKIGIFNELLPFHPKGEGITKLVSFGPGSADIRYVDYQVSLKKTIFRYLLTKENKEIEIDIKGYVLPKAYLEVFAASLAIGKSLGLSEKKISDSLSKNFSMPSGRGSIFEGINSSIIIDSSYNASRASVLTFLEMVEKLSKKENRPLVLLLGDMRELGKEAKIEHETVARRILAINANLVYCVGPNTKKYFKYTRWFKTAIEAGNDLCKTLPSRAIVLVKGSQNEIFLEEAVKKILKNKSDFKKLCRQNDFWIKKKKLYFGSM